MLRRVTRLEEIARLAGVSITTVSRALNDSPAVNRKTKQLIWKLAREHNYPFRVYMPSGPTAAAATIAIVIPRPQGREWSLSDPFVLGLVAGIGEAARQRGLAESETRFAVWGAQLPNQVYCSVGSDNPLGGRRATLHLARLGRRRIVFLGDAEAPEAMQRYQGYLEGLAQSGLKADPQLAVPAHFELEAAEASIDALLGRLQFDGIVAASDLIALGAIRALLRAGLAVPRDVSVVGYDDVPFARYSRPALTTVRQDTALAGRLLVSKLLNADPGGELRSERLPTDLVIRESCGG